MNKNVSLVLGSGGARGMAHVGIIRWLEENEFNIIRISGCSIGSVIGGAYATGRLDQFVDWVTQFDKSDVFSMLDFVFSKDGLVKGDKVMDALKKFIGTENIEDLSMEFTAVAADISREKEHWIQSGPIYDAVRASVSLPLFFTPHIIDGVPLVDGGILNPTPIEPVLNRDADSLIVAVNLGGVPIQEAPIKETVSKSLFQKRLDEFMKMIQKSKSKNETEWDMLYITDQSFNAMQNMIANQKMKANPPDYLVDIPRNKCGTLDFEKSQELIDYGYQMADEQLKKMLALN
ncbi:MAG: patatin-like phospholipase family protein [Reichenbachiella sp.]